jgi:Zn finger protein HypA/HybF involved in hydrogenase expression
VKHPYAPDHPYMSGETVTPGSFECTNCGEALKIEDGRVTNLPVCPRCQNDSWVAARSLLRR